MQNVQQLYMYAVLAGSVAGQLESGCSAQEFLYHLSVTAPGSQSFSVSQDQHLVALIERLRCPDVRGIHDDRPMNTKEMRAGESRFEMAQWLANVVSGIHEMHARDIIAGLNPVDLRRIEKENLAMDLDREPLRRCRQGAELPQ